MINKKLSPKEVVRQALSSGVPMKYGELRRMAKSGLPIRELIEAGEIERLPLGLYALPERDTSWDALAILSAAFPSAVICLASAAAYHGLTIQNPHEVWAAFPYNQTAPRSPEMSIKGFRWKEKSMVAGVETVSIGNVPVKITSPARTVVDFLRFVNRTGDVETAMEVLRNFRGRMADVMKISIELGVERSVRPYTQAAQGMGTRPINT